MNNEEIISELYTEEHDYACGLVLASRGPRHAPIIIGNEISNAIVTRRHRKAGSGAFADILCSVDSECDPSSAAQAIAEMAVILHCRGVSKTDIDAAIKGVVNKVA